MEKDYMELRVYQIPVVTSKSPLLDQMRRELNAVT